MKKMTLALMMGAFLSGSVVTAANLKMGEEFDTELGLHVKKDQFGNMWLSPDTVTPENLKPYILENKDPEKGNAFLVKVTVELFSKTVPDLISNGFQFHAPNKGDGTFEYILRNDSSIPYYMTGIGGAHAIILREGESGIEALIVAQQHSRRVGLVGGSQDPDELPEDTMIREAKEEVGLDVEIVYELAFRSRRNSNRYGANDSCHYYVCRVKGNSDELLLQKKEIKSADWVTVADILNDQWTKNKISGEFKKLLRHYVNHPDEHISELAPDFRQIRKSDEERDKTDVMRYELLSKPKDAKL